MRFALYLLLFGCFSATAVLLEPVKTSTAAPNVQLLSQRFTIAGLNRDRQVRLYLPPGYQLNNKRYPVLYMHDGQMLFDSSTTWNKQAWQVDQVAAPLIADGDLVRVLSPWITNRLTMYAALPSRKFMPQRTRVFLDYLTEQTRLGVAQALSACERC